MQTPSDRPGRRSCLFSSLYAFRSFFANAFLGCNCCQCVAELRENGSEQTQLVNGQLTG